MSLHVLANHMASKGRGEDSMLVHMTPHEVAGLQALALKHGGSLTINPQTGLPEAGFLKSLLPMIAGFALGPAGFGLMSAGMAGATVGAVTGLATGSLSKGLMAGLGAYGGAGLGEAFMGAGANALTNAGVANYADTLAAQGLTPGTAAYGEAASKLALESQAAANSASAFDKLGAGFKAVTSSPESAFSFAKNNLKTGLAAAAPVVADAMVPTATKMPTGTQVPGYIRPYQYDANTHTVKAMDPVLASEWGTRQFPSFIPKTQAQPQQQMQPQPPGGMARGGIVALAEGGETDPYARFNTMSGQSKAAYDYLMGNAPSVAPSGVVIPTRPVVSNTNAPVIPATGGGGGASAGGSGAGVGEIGGGIVTLPSVNPTEPVVAPPMDDGTTAGIQDVIEQMPETPMDDGTTTGIQDVIERMPETPMDDGTTPGIQDIIERMPETPMDDGTTPGIQEIIDRMPETAPVPMDDGTTTGIQEIIDRMPVEALPAAPMDDGTTPGIQEIIDRMPADTFPEAPMDDGTTASIQDIINSMPVEEVPDFWQPNVVEAPVDASKYTEDVPYEVQPWEYLDNSGYANGPMAGDNSLNSENNTYIGGNTSVQQEGLPDEFGSYPGEATYIPAEGSYSRAGYPGGIPGYEGYEQYGDYGDLSGGYGSYYGAANGGMVPGYAMGGGLGSLGGYSDGGRLLKGPGDGVSDSIPATIGAKGQPARLADGEFVVPARIVSELGNGSTDAGARKLYAMMDRIQKARGKTVGKGKVAANSRADKHLPA